MPADDSVTLPSGLQAPAHARAWVAERAGGLAPDVLEDALLVTSELVTNAVRHGGPDITLTVRHVAGGLHIAVRDAGSAIPALVDAAPAPDRPTGRGLLIVEATARTWGVTPEGTGKTVWAELVS